MWSPSVPQFDIVVETLTGSEFELTVTERDTVAFIKRQIQKHEGIPVKLQHLIFNERQLDDDQQLCDVPLVRGSRLKFVVDMRGGPISARRTLLHATAGGSCDCNGTSADRLESNASAWLDMFVQAAASMRYRTKATQTNGGDAALGSPERRPSRRFARSRAEPPAGDSPDGRAMRRGDRNGWPATERPAGPAPPLAGAEMWLPENRRTRKRLQDVREQLRARAERRERDSTADGRESGGARYDADERVADWRDVHSTDEDDGAHVDMDGGAAARQHGTAPSDDEDDDERDCSGFVVERPAERPTEPSLALRTFAALLADRSYSLFADDDPKDERPSLVDEPARWSAAGGVAHHRRANRSAECLTTNAFDDFGGPQRRRSARLLGGVSDPFALDRRSGADKGDNGPAADAGDDGVLDAIRQRVAGPFLPKVGDAKPILGSLLERALSESDDEHSGTSVHRFGALPQLQLPDDEAAVRAEARQSQSHPQLQRIHRALSELRPAGRHSAMVWSPAHRSDDSRLNAGAGDSSAPAVAASTDDLLATAERSRLFGVIGSRSARSASLGVFGDGAAAAPERRHQTSDGDPVGSAAPMPVDERRASMRQLLSRQHGSSPTLLCPPPGAHQRQHPAAGRSLTAVDGPAASASPATAQTRLDAVPFQYRRGYANLPDVCLSSSASSADGSGFAAATAAIPLPDSCFDYAAESSDAGDSQPSFRQTHRSAAAVGSERRQQLQLHQHQQQQQRQQQQRRAARRAGFMRATVDDGHTRQPESPVPAVDGRAAGDGGAEGDDCRHEAVAAAFVRWQESERAAYERAADPRRALMFNFDALERMASDEVSSRPDEVEASAAGPNDSSESLFGDGGQQEALDAIEKLMLYVDDEDDEDGDEDGGEDGADVDNECCLPTPDAFSFYTGFDCEDNEDDEDGEDENDVDYKDNSAILENSLDAIEQWQRIEDAMIEICGAETSPALPTLVDERPMVEGLPAQGADAPEEAQVPLAQKRPRCAECNRRLGLAMAMRCRCERMFCAQHRYPETHRCTFDFRAQGRVDLERDNPLVVAAKLTRI